LVGGEADDFNEPIVSGLILISIMSPVSPGVSASSVTGYVEEEDGVHLLLPQFPRYVLAVALQSHEFRQILPLALQQIFAAGLAVEHLVAQPRIELLWAGLYKNTISFKTVQRRRKKKAISQLS